MVRDAVSERVGAGDPVVRTVLGDIDPATLGPCDYHEHLFQASPLLPGDELDDESRSGEEARLFAVAGMAAMVEATPVGLGRNPGAAARISGETGLAIVHATGAHHSGHYAEDHWIRRLDVDALRAWFLAEVTDGIQAEDDGAVGAVTPDGTRVRAGLVKTGILYWRIGAFERRVLEAAAAVSAQTGVAVMVHLEFGSAAHEVLDLLGSGGMPADRVILAHADRNLDAGLHAELAARGAYLGYDGVARHRNAPDSAILDCAAEVIERGGGDRLLLGGDVARRTRYVAYGGMPGLQYLPERFLPRLRERVGGAAADRMLVDNPARALTFAAAPQR